MSNQIKPLDLATLIRHAYLSGFVAAKNLPAHEPYNGIEEWVKYMPPEELYDKLYAKVYDVE